jgi:hypothetical protein
VINTVVTPNSTGVIIIIQQISPKRRVIFVDEL